jgi:hypothetical protein
MFDQSNASADSNQLINFQGQDFWINFDTMAFWPVSSRSPSIDNVPLYRGLHSGVFFDEDALVFTTLQARSTLHLRLHN